MAYLKRKYYYRDEDVPKGLNSLYTGFDILNDHPLFSQLKGNIFPKASHLNGKDAFCCVTKCGDIFSNITSGLDANEWAYVLAHGLLHLAFGHFDKDKMPQEAEVYPCVWNKACDIYVTRFLADIGFGKPLFPDPATKYSIRLNDEVKIYDYLLKTEGTMPEQSLGLNTTNALDMIGLGAPVFYRKGEKNEYTKTFSHAITRSIKEAVSEVGGHDFGKKKDTVVTRAAEWFLAHYPLLGGLASSFKIIEDVDLCHKYEIHIAAVDARQGEIYINPSCGLTIEEWKFVLAHEYLHAGLCHYERCQGRDRYLWNVACDYVINDWLHEMRIGDMPEEGLLYDKELHAMSAEAIYDLIVKQMRKFKKHACAW